MSITFTQKELAEMDHMDLEACVAIQRIENLDGSISFDLVRVDPTIDELLLRGLSRIVGQDLSEGLQKEESE